MGSLLNPAGQPLALAAGEYVQSAPPNLITFSCEDVEPPSTLYVQRDDILLISGIALNNGESLNVTARFLPATPQVTGQPASGEGTAPAPVKSPGAQPIITVMASLAMPVAGTVYTLSIPFSEGYLLGIGITAGFATSRGQTFARGFLHRGTVGATAAVASIALFGDYATTQFAVGWPASRLMFPSESTGLRANVPVSSPGAGADWGYTTVTNTRTKLLHWNAQLVTSATVANRIVRATIKDPGGVLTWQGLPSSVIPASTTAQVSAGPGANLSTVDATTVNVNLPGDTFIFGHGQLAVSTLNLQAGDQWSNVNIALEQWIDYA